MSHKKEQKKDNDPLSCVIVADSYDARFAPLLATVGLWCLQTICNVPLIYYTLSWIMRTEIRKVLLVVSKKNSDLLKKVERERRIENKNNVMTLIFSDLKTAENAVIGIETSSKKLRIYHRKEDPAQLDIDKFSSHCLGFSALSGNVYVAVSEQEFGRLLPAGSVPKRAFNTTFGLRCKIDDTVTTNCATIGNDTHIGPNSLLVNCIIGEKCVIGADCRIVDAVLGNGVHIPDGTNLQKQSVISSEVFYPPDFDIPPNSVVCAEPPNEDFEEMIKYKLVEGCVWLSYIFQYKYGCSLYLGDDLFVDDLNSESVHIWSFANGGSFWCLNERCDSGNGSMSEENDIENGTESEGGDPAELNATAQFYEEVAESMERIQGFTFSNQQMHNLILEINSSKLAYNISMEDVAKYVFFAFLGLPGNDSWIKLKEDDFERLSCELPSIVTFENFDKNIVHYRRLKERAGLTICKEMLDVFIARELSKVVLNLFSKREQIHTEADL
ncbi:unnamed protein product [Angiostrongylus costaricensis]|uniref:W2 domain-containing protein n=1 Tax=Angiostrongylus costaricensis TaxID=334426 RepID=A0A158PHX6_ANGCS|nr:unnamed protein product [Angiostrongylus costaricensis]